MLHFFVGQDTFEDMGNIIFLNPERKSLAFSFFGMAALPFLAQRGVVFIE